jgi:hypothetical protein
MGARSMRRQIFIVGAFSSDGDRQLEYKNFAPDSEAPGLPDGVREVLLRMSKRVDACDVIF